VSATHPAHSQGLEVNEVADGLVIYHPTKDRVHYLNATSSLIFELCDGSRSSEQIADLVADAYELPKAPRSETRQCLTTMFSEDLLQ
jgi:hypothetical protein